MFTKARKTLIRSSLAREVTSVYVKNIFARYIPSEREKLSLTQMWTASQRATCAAPVSVPSIGSPWQHPRHARRPHGESPFFEEAPKPLQRARRKPVFANSARRRVIYVICIKNSSAKRRDTQEIEMAREAVREPRNELEGARNRGNFVNTKFLALRKLESGVEKAVGLSENK